MVYIVYRLQYSIQSTTLSMASISVMAAPQVSPPNQTELSFCFSQEHSQVDDMAIQGSEFCDTQQRYRLESYQPSQLQDSPNCLGDAECNLPISQQFTVFTQGYSSGYMTGSSGPKTPDVNLMTGVRTDSEITASHRYDQLQGDDQIWMDIPQMHEKSTSRVITSHPQMNFTYENSQGAAHAPLQQSTPVDKGLEFQYNDPPQWQSNNSSSLQNTQPPCCKLRPTRPLMIIMRKLKDLDPSTRQQLQNADEHLRKGNLDKAIEHLEGSLLLTNDYPRLQMAVWMLLGSTQIQLGQYKKASVCHLHYLAFCREVEDFHGMTKAECNLGIAYLKLGLLKLAGRCFLQYLDNCRILQDDVGIGAACSNLGMLSKSLALHRYQAALMRGNSEKANEALSTNLNRSIAYFEQHLAIVEQYGDMEKQARAYSNLGSCYELLKQYSQAIFCHNKRMDIVRIIGDKMSECCSLCNLGNCFRGIGKLQEAVEYYRLSLELSEVSRNPQVEMVSLLNLGITCELMNKLDKAIEWHTLYLSMAVQLNDLKSQARGFSSMAGLYEETGQTRKAHEYYQKLVGVFKKLGETDAEVVATSYLETIQRIVKDGKKRSKKYSRGTLRKRFKTVLKGHTISRGSGIKDSSPRGQLSSLFSNQIPIERSGSTRNKMGTWSAAQGKQYLSQQREMSNSESFSSTLVFGNPATAFLQDQFKYQAEVAAHVVDQTHLYDRVIQPQDAYSTLSFPYANQPGEFQGIGPAGLDNSEADEKETYPFYSLGRVIETSCSPSSMQQYSHLNYLPPPPPREYAENEIIVDVHHDPEAESSTDYDSVSDNSVPPSKLTRRESISVPEGAPSSEIDHSVSFTSSSTVTSSQVWGSQRHLQELQKLQKDLSQTDGLSDDSLLDGGVDKEWEQWLNLQDMNALTRVVSVNMGQIYSSQSKSYTARRRNVTGLKLALSEPACNLCDDGDNGTSSSGTYIDSSQAL